MIKDILFSCVTEELKTSVSQSIARSTSAGRNRPEFTAAEEVFLQEDLFP